MWKEILKSEFQTSPKKGTSEHGIQITKMYMFLKRYFADEHTPQFKKLYVTLDVMNKRDVNRLSGIIQNAKGVFLREFGDLLERGEVLPGAYIDIRGLEKPTSDRYNYQRFSPDKKEKLNMLFGRDKFNIKFDDARHKEVRDRFIRNSYEGGSAFTNKVGSRYDAVPASRTIQSFWYQLSRVIKKSNNYYWDEEW